MGAEMCRRDSSYTMVVVLVSFVFFRAESSADALNYLSNLGSNGDNKFGRFAMIMPIVVLGLDWIVKGSGEEGPFSQFSYFFQSLWFGLFVFLILLCGLSYPSHQFIYFQF